MNERVVERRTDVPRKKEVTEEQAYINEVIYIYIYIYILIAYTF